MKKYESPKFELLKLHSNDVITTSMVDPSNPTPDNDENATPVIPFNLYN